MSTAFDRVRDYYKSFDEWNRLDAPEGVIEFQRTLDFLKTYLTPNSRILDLGGGPGRYALELLRWKHRVVIADIAPALLEAARRFFAAPSLREGIESIDEVNAVDLSRYSEGSFDAVLALGPFYHLVLEDERECAAREIYRVLRPGGVAFVAHIPRISGIVGLIQRAAIAPMQVTPNVLRMVAETGVFHNPSDSGFQEGYYPLPGEIAELLLRSGFGVKDEVSLRSIAHRLEKEVGQFEEPMKAEVYRLVDSVSRQPEIIATSGHVLIVASKKAP